MSHLDACFRPGRRRVDGLAALSAAVQNGHAEDLLLVQ